MRHPLDPRDGWPQVSTLEFLGYLLAAFAIVGITWILAVTYLVWGGA